MKEGKNRLHAACQPSTCYGAAQLITCSLHTGRAGVTPGLARRWALVLLHSLVPYALERAAPSGLVSGNDESGGPSAPGQPRWLQESMPEPGEVLSLGGSTMVGGVPWPCCCQLVRCQDCHCEECCVPASDVAAYSA